MSYQVLARKWRPKSFNEIVGQTHVVRALTHALEQQRLHHAYLFTGTRGVGKTTLSRILAKSLNCETGITATPCGKCVACLSIDKGSFIDYIELDAASNRGIEDMTALLEQAVYAPTQGRFKVYMLDEVHQLTGHAFNAMLKTLEEPPAHVKFILATTDPQKVPVTILSRCLQFNLKQMTVPEVAAHLMHVLDAESIAYEKSALQLVARAAAGSMRDALSLLDQAIAFGGNRVDELEVRNMLGAIDQRYLFTILEALASQDGKSLLAQVKSMEARSLSFDTALADLALLLHHISVAQTVPEAIDGEISESEAIHAIAKRLNPECVQLYYQIALLGRRDLSLAPDEFAGFSMCLLRMLAFAPTEVLMTSTPTIKPHSDVIIPQAPSSEATPILAPSSITELTDATESGLTEVFDGNWRALIEKLRLGLARGLAENAELIRFDMDNLYFQVPESQKQLLNFNYQEKLSALMAQHFGRNIQLHFSVGTAANTPAAQASEERLALQSKAVAAIEADAFVQSMQALGAEVVHSSIKPTQ